MRVVVPESGSYEEVGSQRVQVECGEVDKEERAYFLHIDKARSFAEKYDYAQLREQTVELRDDEDEDLGALGEWKDTSFWEWSGEWGRMF
jgi:hypothetical protein